MPLFDPTFYDNEQQGEETEKPKEKDNSPWFFIGGSLLTAMAIGIGIWLGVI